MMYEAIEIKELQHEYVKSVVDLFYERQQFESNYFNETYFDDENKHILAKRLEEKISNDKIVGLCFFEEHQLSGYLLSEVVTGSRFGTYAYVPYEGVAVKQGKSSDFIRFMYAKIASRWIQLGCYDHTACIPLGNPTYIEAFLDLSFSIEQVHGILDLSEFRMFDDDSSVSVRHVQNGDRSRLQKMSSIISITQSASPSFVPLNAEYMTMLYEGYGNLVNSDDIVLIAEKQEEIVGFSVFEVPLFDVMLPEGSLILDVAGVVPEYSRSGVGKQLMNCGYSMARGKGYNYLKTDWRVTNLSSSGFWSKCGFKKIAYRMSRYIDPNYKP